MVAKIYDPSNETWSDYQQYCTENLVDAPSDGFLYGRKDGDWEQIDISGGINIISLTYIELKNLRDNGQLVPGQSYRITDYTTTTIKADTTSTGHDFDIVVTALSTNKLSENAKCVRKAGDTYFANAKLEAWELKYCIDNDTNRFVWADSVNGKGVIYYMKDEWGNECPYDFKNIQYLKNDVWVYTFGGTTDNSLTGGCHHNTMMDYMSNSVLTLNFNTFGVACSSNTFGNNCSSNTFGDYCSYNTFGNGCYSNTFGNYCCHNTFGSWYHSNTFGNYCCHNTFGDDCFYNTFGNECRSNTFGDNCVSNTFGNNCSSNTFGNWCYSNTFGNRCYSNIFGDECSSNTFGNWCYSNTFGNYCSFNNFYIGTSGTTKKNYIRYIVLENGCINNNFYSTLTTSDNNYLQRIRIKGLNHTTTKDTQIELSDVNTNYEWVIAKNSSGIIEQYCPEDHLTNATNILYADLLNLIDNNELIPNLSYRITDYTTTTVQADTQSAGHDFDIVVTALDEGHLLENASATYHEGDTYFSSNNAKLEAWEIKYCIENDTSRFAWADTENGKGVIYYMKDEFNNDVPYDFKNIKFLKNSVWLYTFGGTTDDSLTGNSYGNIIKEYKSSNKLSLSFNTFGDSCYFNTFGNSCYSNTFGNNCNFNTFGNYCYSNTFGNNCGNNTFGNSCTFNTFGNGCYSNTFGDYCRSNNFYAGASGTTRKDYIRYIVLEDGCRYNNFYSNVTTSSTTYLQRIRIKGLENATATSTIITLSTANTNYDWVVAKNSSGVIKQYCPEDLVQ